MPIASTDIILYGSANIPEDDSGASGGAINKTIEMLNQDMQDVGGTDTLNVVSSSAADNTQTVTITGRDASGIIVTDTYNLNGVTPVTGSQSFERVLKIVVNATYAGTLTISENSGSVTLTTMAGSGVAPGGTAILTKRRLFYGATAEASGGSQKDFYEKFFVANTHSALALLGAAIELTIDGTANNRLDFDLEDAVNDNNSTANRLTEPTGMLGAPTWNDSIKSVPGGNLGDRTTGTSDHIGVWMRLQLPAGESPENTNFTINVTGSST